jgi:hypothetical protein
MFLVSFNVWPLDLYFCQATTEITTKTTQIATGMTDPDEINLDEDINEAATELQANSTIEEAPTHIRSFADFGIGSITGHSAILQFFPHLSTNCSRFDSYF